MTMAGRFPEFGAVFPAWLFDAFNPNDKENLAPYRVLHFIVVAFVRHPVRPEGLERLEPADLQTAGRNAANSRWQCSAPASFSPSPAISS